MKKEPWENTIELIQSLIGDSYEIKRLYTREYGAATIEEKERNWTPEDGKILILAEKDKISSLTINILQERENYPNYSLEKLYDPDVMPDSLKQAHLELDNFIEEKYSKSPLSDDFERLSLMMKMYKGKAFA